MKEKIYHIYEDPGHAWLKVKLSEIVKLGIGDKISGFSYVRNGYAYLEEDCDLNIFAKAMRDQNSTIVKFREHHTDKSSKIRSYERFSKNDLTNL